MSPGRTRRGESAAWDLFVLGPIDPDEPPPKVVLPHLGVDLRMERAGLSRYTFVRSEHVPTYPHWLREQRHRLAADPAPTLDALSTDALLDLFARGQRAAGDDADLAGRRIWHARRGALIGVALTEAAADADARGLLLTARLAAVYLYASGAQKARFLAPRFAMLQERLRDLPMAEQVAAVFAFRLSAWLDVRCAAWSTLASPATTLALEALEVCPYFGDGTDWHECLRHAPLSESERDTLERRMVGVRASRNARSADGRALIAR